MDVTTLGKQMQRLLGLRWPPIAVAFRSEAPPNLQRIARAAPAGCGYWRLAAEGQVFYTEASDHYHCPIGAHTHGIDLPAHRAKELDSLVETMVGIEYIQMDEVTTMPRRKGTFGIAIYAPLAAAPVAPDVVLVRGTPKQMMLLMEAVRAARISHDIAAMLRPTCAIVPDAIEAARASVSLGCIGNRVYTELADDEMYCAIPGPKVAAAVDKLETIISANRTLENFHHARKTTA